MAGPAASDQLARMAKGRKVAAPAATAAADRVQAARPLGCFVEQLPADFGGAGRVGTGVGPVLEKFDGVSRMAVRAAAALAT